VLVWQTVNVGGLVKRIDDAVEKKGGEPSGLLNLSTISCPSSVQQGCNADSRLILSRKAKTSD
jgi:hypothetical protein